MQLLREYDMPSPMTFKEEGGVSLSPDGSKFIAVSVFFVAFFSWLFCALNGL